MDLIVTTASNGGIDGLAMAQKLAEGLSSPFVPRNKQSLDHLRGAYGVKNILVVGRKKTSIVTPEGEYFFHPSMAKLRILQIKKGRLDPMVKAMGLEPGDRVLDCTLGLASDALVCSFVVGPQGEVVGLEGVQVLAAVIGLGLRNYADEDPDLTSAAQRIKVEAMAHLDYLSTQPDASFDVVFFDPMFRHPKIKSSSINPLRGITITNPISEEVLHEALRVARKRVVMKESNGSKEFSRLGFPVIEGGKYSPVAYGVMEVNNAEAFDNCGRAHSGGENRSKYRTGQTD